MSTIREAMLLAARHMERGEAHAARAIYERIQSQAPGHAESAFFLGVVRWRIEGAAGARPALERAAGLAPHDARCRKLLGIALLELGEPAAAAGHLRAALDVVPADALAHKSLADALAAIGDLRAAEAAYRHALALEPRFAAAQQRLGALLRAEGREVEFQHGLRAYLRANPIVAWSDAPAAGAAPRPRVLALYGLQAPEFEHVRPAHPDVLAFSIAGGHFRITDVIRRGRFEVTGAFLDPDVDVAALHAALPGIDAVVNCIADPDRETEALARAEALAARLGVGVLNAPRAVRRTARDAIAREIEGTPGIDLPRIARVPGADEGAARAAIDRARLRFPLLVRPTGTHTGEGIRRIEAVQALGEALAALAADEVYAIEFHDFRSADGHYRKLRVFCIDGRPYPEHLVISDRWNVHSADRLRLMRDTPWMRAEEEAFLRDPARVAGEALLEGVAAWSERLGLDYFGVDFTLGADGRVLVFEANPSMRINLDYVTDFPYQAPYLEALLDALESAIARRCPGARAG